MREYELELIASLAEGTLEDETEARALIGSSPQLRAEFEAQVRALERLRDESMVTMSDTERAALRRDVWSRLRSATTSAGSRVPWYYRWVPAAAALVVVVGVLSVLPRSGEDGALETAADVTTTAGAAAGALDTDDAGGEGGSEAPAAPTAADERALLYENEVQRLRSERLTDFEAYDLEETSGSEEMKQCVATAGLSDYQLLGTISDPTAADTEESGDARDLIVAVPNDSDLATGPVALVDLLTCELVHLEE